MPTRAVLLFVASALFVLVLYGLTIFLAMHGYLLVMSNIVAKGWPTGLFFLSLCIACLASPATNRTHLTALCAIAVVCGVLIINFLAAHELTHSGNPMFEHGRPTLFGVYLVSLAATIGSVWLVVLKDAARTLAKRIAGETR